MAELISAQKLLTRLGRTFGKDDFVIGVVNEGVFPVEGDRWLVARDYSLGLDKNLKLAEEDKQDTSFLKARAFYVAPNTTQFPPFTAGLPAYKGAKFEWHPKLFEWFFGSDAGDSWENYMFSFRFPKERKMARFCLNAASETMGDKCPSEHNMMAAVYPCATEYGSMYQEFFYDGRHWIAFQKKYV
jgi:hypothetical protein